VQKTALKGDAGGVPSPHVYTTRGLRVGASRGLFGYAFSKPENWTGSLTTPSGGGTALSPWSPMALRGHVVDRRNGRLNVSVWRILDCSALAFTYHTVQRLRSS
jgi:hypothetical protein